MLTRSESLAPRSPLDPFALALLVAVTGCESDGTATAGETASTSVGASTASTIPEEVPTTAGETPTSSDSKGTETAADESGDSTVGASATEPSTTTEPSSTSEVGDSDGCDPAAEPEPEPAPSIKYTGMQYDFGGAKTPIDGTVEVVDAIADSITASAAQTVEQIAARRATLTYGAIETNHCEPPQLTIYPGPPGIPASDQYAVTVTQGGVDQSSFVYKVKRRKVDTNGNLDTSWTSFSFKGPVTVRVKQLAGDATGCLVRPYSAAIQAQFADHACTFTVERPGQFSVEFEPNIHNPVLHPMLVFANPPEVDVPPSDDPNVRFFGPGVHKPGKDQPIQSGQTIYLAGGAWVEGAFLAAGPVQDVVIRGRGVISGLFLDKGVQEQNKDAPGIIDIPYQASENVLIEGITLVDGPRYNIRALSQYTTINNVKVMSWWYSTDGVVGGNKSLIEGNFIKVNDDSIKLHWGDTIVRRNVLWQLENGGTFNLSWNIHDDVKTFHIYDNDVIHAEHHELEAEAVFRSRHAGSGTLSRYLFEDIRVENANWRLFYLVIENNKWYDPNLGYGEIDQVIFRNIHAYSATHQRPNVVLGIDGKHKVRNVSFQNVFTDDTCISSAQPGKFEIDSGTTNAIRIMKSKDGSCHTP